jgi:hypothetical protein
VTADELARLEASWPTCDFWSLDEHCEQLSHASVAEALELDQLRTGEHALGWFTRWRELGTLTVFGWTRKAVHDRDVDSMVERLTEAFHEHWCESLELGDPEADRDDEPEWLRAALTADMRARRVWACEQTHRIELSVDAVIAIARRDVPALLAGKPPLGVMPEWLWAEFHPSPSPDDESARACDLEAAVERHRGAGREPPRAWLVELAVRRGGEQP